MFREPEGTKVVETDFLEAAPTDYDEVNIGERGCKLGGACWRGQVQVQGGENFMTT